ncbi:hypothetical protein H8F21_28735 [Pseudomonas sp. P66]|uniref:ORC1/DEAH AAA+ ATPase domain-containing protein n=1 Tax=Pseudomonas arcuscaelestis TaxID=2710591 RepID=A0ABS2C6T3_9PSED|nr:AAA family ATPase [Pseudomonas arcuscaelestis]MBM5461547.1 hypothetical protein [Pseudomonas arcuscaelestis]
MSDATEKIASALSFQPVWQDLAPSLDLMARIEEFSECDAGPRVFVAYGEPGCGMTRALSRHFSSAAPHSVWLGAKLLGTKATLYDRLARYMGVYNVCHRLDRLPKYLLRILELRRVRIIYVDDADQFMLDRMAAESFIADIALLARSSPALHFVLSIKSSRADVERSSLLKSLHCVTHNLQGLNGVNSKELALAMLKELNELNGTTITLASEVSRCPPPGRGLGELVDWVKLAFATAWITEKQIDPHASYSKLWKVLDDFLE